MKNKRRRDPKQRAKEEIGKNATGENDLDEKKSSKRGDHMS